MPETKTNFVEELNWRGMVHDMMPGTEEQLNNQITSAYIGFDPTAPSLHIGNLATVMLLKHLQLAGHRPVALVGGATGMIGDPSGKSDERKLLDEETLRSNEQGIKTQLNKFLHFDDSATGALLVNNYDWFGEFNLLQFLRDAGKHITVNYMMAKDSVKTRLEQGISYTEFTYQLLQGYDFYHLFANHNVKLQMGGSDQWGNITTGTEFIRRMTGDEAFALTTPLLTKADGSKFGKSEEGNVWLDSSMTSPYKFYQFWLNVSDEDCPKLLRRVTLLDKPTIEKLEKDHADAPHQRIMQQTLAKEMTTMVHSEEEYNKAVKASGILFGKSTEQELKALDESTFLEIFEGVPQINITHHQLTQNNNTQELLSEGTEFQIFKSKGEARRMIQNGGVSINKNKIDGSEAVSALELIGNKYLLVQKGKKNYFIISVK